MKNTFNYLKILISVALLSLLVWLMRDKLSNVGIILTQVDKSLIASAFGLILVGMFMQSLRLKLLLDVQGVHLTLRDVIYLTMIGQFFNNFMPTSIGGDVVKAYYASGHTRKKLETFTAVIIDRMLGVITLALLALIALFMKHNEHIGKSVLIMIALMAVIGIIFLAVIFNAKAARIFLFFKRLTKFAKIKEQLEKLYEATNKFRHHKMALVHGLWLSLTAQLIFFYMSYVLAISISSKVSFVFLLLTLPAVCVVSMLPSLGGLGIRENGFVHFLGGTIGSDKAFVFSVLYFAIAIAAPSLLGGIIFMFKREFKHIIKSEVTIK